MSSITTDRPPQTEDPLVSVILPVYNGEASIGATLESALRQTYRNIEVIVIDDGSTDRTPAVVEERAAGDTRVQIIRQTNGGVAHARNRGLAAARGEFIAPLDADDLWDPTKVERQVRRMGEAGGETGLVYCWWVWIDGEGAVLDRSPRWHVEQDALAMLLQVNFTGNASVPLYRRHVLEHIGGYDEKLAEQRGQGCEDWDVALKVAERYPVAVTPEVLVGYRRRHNSMSTSCGVMWRSQMLVTQELRRRRPALAARLFQRSADQFALYLAGVSFWSGSYVRAIGWGLRAWRSGLAFQVLPHVLRVFARRLSGRRRASALAMRPGVRLDESGIPEPLIPYDRLYRRIMR
jgi:glycosyltransferase involved in cell wall biosynthesis